MDNSAVQIGSVHTTRLGDVWVALSSRGLIAVEYGVTRAAFENIVRKQTRSEVEVAPGRVTEATRQIKEYVDGKRRTFDIKIDWSVLASDFQRSALRVVHSIPYGKTLTYAQVAEKI